MSGDPPPPRYDMAMAALAASASTSGQQLRGRSVEPAMSIASQRAVHPVLPMSTMVRAAFLFIRLSNCSCIRTRRPRR